MRSLKVPGSPATLSRGTAEVSVETLHESHLKGAIPMYDKQKIEDAVLALLGAFEFENGRAWKRFDFEVMASLADQGLISEPRGRAESVHLTPDGMVRAKALAQQLFGR